MTVSFETLPHVEHGSSLFRYRYLYVFVTLQKLSALCLVDIYGCRVTVAYCSLSGLDLLGGLDAVGSERQLIIDWFYSLQQKTTTVGEHQTARTFIHMKICNATAYIG